MLAWADEMAEMLNRYLQQEPIYVEITNDPKRIGSIGRLVINNVDDIMSGRQSRYEPVKRRPNLATQSMFISCPYINCSIRWEKRANQLNYVQASSLYWHKDRTKEEGTVWVFEKPKIDKVIPTDRLGRAIEVNDFISYILYQFDGGGAAGIYYGKVTKIEDDGTVWAKNIKLNETERQAEKKIKDSKLAVIMTADLMDQLMLARLSSL